MYEIGKQLAIIHHAVRRSVEKDAKCELMKLSMANGWILMYLHDHAGEDVFQKNIEENVVTRAEKVFLMETIKTQKFNDYERIVFCEKYTGNKI